MKSKDSPNLYEILRSSARPKVEASVAPDPAPATAVAAPKPSLLERLAAFKLRKKAPPPPSEPEAQPAGESCVAPSGEGAAEAMSEAVSAPLAEGAVEEKREAASHGERILRVTYNTAAFLVLVGIGLLFVAYSLGVKVGRTRAAAPEAPSRAAMSTPLAPSPLPGTPVVSASAPAVPSEVYAINLIEWKGETTEQRREAMRMGEIWTRKLNEAGHPGAKHLLIRRGDEQRVALYIGAFASRSSEDARAKLDAMRSLKFRGNTPFSQASFEQDPSSR